MRHFGLSARLTLILGLALLLAGLLVLLVVSWIEYLRSPGTSLVQALGVRREPWSSLAAWCALVGSAVILIAGGAVALAEGSWIRRMLVIPTIALPAYWWLTALGVLRATGFHGPDPIGLARLLPETTAITLVLPAGVMAALALFPHADLPTSRMRRIHDEQERRDARERR